MSLQHVREEVEYNKQVDAQIAQILRFADEDIAELEKTRILVNEIDERKIGLCDWFRTTKYYKPGMTDEDIIARHNRLNEECND